MLISLYLFVSLLGLLKRTFSPLLLPIYLLAYLGYCKFCHYRGNPLHISYYFTRFPPSQTYTLGLMTPDPIRRCYYLHPAVDVV